MKKTQYCVQLTFIIELIDASLKNRGLCPLILKMWVEHGSGWISNAPVLDKGYFQSHWSQKHDYKQKGWFYLEFRLKIEKNVKYSLFNFPHCWGLTAICPVVAVRRQSLNQASFRSKIQHFDKSCIYIT